MRSEQNRGILDLSVLEIDLKTLPWVQDNSGNVQFEEPSNGSVCSLTADKPLSSQVVRLPEGHVSAVMFFSFFPEEVFRKGPSHPDWYETFALTATELSFYGRIPVHPSAFD